MNIKNSSSKIKIIIMSIISIALMSVLIGFSFAYFTANSDNTDNQKMSIENGSMELTYTDCVNKSDCSNISADLEPGDSISKTFSVKNTGTLDTDFKIVFSKSSNTFVDNELVYTLYNNDDNKEITNGIVPYGENTNSYVYTDSIKTSETKNYKLTINFKNVESGNNESNKEGTFNINFGIAANNVWNFDYTGGEQTFTIPKDGIYELQTWGASGGDGDNIYIGGYGGYSIGKIKLKFNDKIYLNVGGRGITTSGFDVTTAGGYNGGGSSINSVHECNYYFLGSGGGATSITTVSGLLASLSNNINSILEVSGGGGGLKL